MKDFTIKRTISGIIILAFFSSSFILPLNANAATGLNWNNPNQKNAFKLDASTLLNANNLMAVVGCTGIVDTATDAAMRLVSKVTSKVLNKLIAGGEVSVTDAQQIAQEKISDKRQACFDGLAYALAKQQLVSMTKSTMNWVNSGFNGDPMYVRNVNSLINNIEGTILQKEVDLFKNSPAGGGDYPYGRDFALSQINSFKFGQNTSNALKQNLSNYLSTAPGSDRYVESYTNNFSLGGWNGWLAFTQMPQNNPLGFNMIASENLANKQNKEVTNTKSELSQNGGFLDQKKCVAYGISETSASNNSIKQQEQAILANDSNLLKKAQDRMQADCRKDLNGLDCAQSTDSYKQINNKYQTEADDYARKYSATNGAAQGQDIKDCTKFETVTPGSLIKDKVSKYLNSGETQLELADSLNEVLYSIFGNLISRFQKNGLSSLSSNLTDFSTVSTGIGANRIVDENGVSITSGNDGSGIDPSSNFDITTDLGPIIATQQKYIATVNKLFPPLEEVMSKLGELDYCIPGPNPNWQENSTNAKDAYYAWLNSIAVVGSSSGFLGSSNYTITIPDINSAASQNYINSINNNIKYWQTLQSSWYFNLGFGDTTAGVAANAQDRITNRINPRMDEVDKAEAEYKTAADLLYGFKSPMQTEYLNIGMPNQTENPEFLAMAQTGLSITRDINSYADSIGEMTTTYQNRIIETNSNIYKLKKLKEKIDIIVNRAQALRTKTRAENGLPPITKECLANEKTNLAQ